MIIIVTGTPGTGKTVIAKLIAKRFHMDCISVNDIIKKAKIKTSYDKKRKCLIVDPQKAGKTIMKMIKRERNYVIESHFAQWLFPKKVDLGIVTTCPLLVLKKRLAKRGYSKEKIKENMDSEIFQICLCEANENLKCPLFVFDTTKSKKSLLQKIQPFIER